MEYWRQNQSGLRLLLGDLRKPVDGGDLSVFIAYDREVAYKVGENSHDSVLYLHGF